MFFFTLSVGNFGNNYIPKLQILFPTSNIKNLSFFNVSFVSMGTSRTGKHVRFVGSSCQFPAPH